MACPALFGATKAGGAGTEEGAAREGDERAEEEGGGWGSRLSSGAGGNPKIANASAKASLTEEEAVDIILGA